MPYRKVPTPASIGLNLTSPNYGSPNIETEESGSDSEGSAIRLSHPDSEVLASSSSPPKFNGFRNGGIPKPSDVFIAVMGVTGSGKSSFISMCSDTPVEIGHTFEACTSTVDVYSCSLLADRTVYLIDTPGFDDTHRSDPEVLVEIAEWLAESYRSKILLHGIIYLHRITDTRMQGSAKKNLVLFKKLCGEDTLQKVALATTMWNMVNKQEGLQREQELMNTQEYWGSMLSKGSTIHRHYHTRESAMNIITQLASRNKPFATDLQTQLVDQRLTLDRTSVGKALQSELLTQRQIWEEELGLIGQHDERVARMETRLREQQEKHAARENLPKRAAGGQAGNSRSGDRKEFSQVSVAMFGSARNSSKAALEELKIEAQVDDTTEAAGEDSNGLNDLKPLDLADDLGSVVDPPDVAQFTDSGYASVGRDAGPMSDEKTILTQLAVEPDSTKSRNEDMDDTATVYSIAWSVPEDELDTYKSELSEAILKNLRRHVSDVELLESLATILPSSLKSFALRLGCPGSSKAEKEVMYFVHKHRMCV
ncbi:hypothetical protein BGZ61DRAFT_1503 [Ilyonectria robusta]|uniref:uncharacterized protein n=1 Tax=Ilyonectria robusta TaxID=1079257 RepID=UPI001E8EB962|nr:uncharacterized protein BGZ61DRAFT_1503 [Ilyonectria robusta]KAH8736710.1 hypothetical protein BGZ61DRAFT_1503 [Ilyonectria robusta]